MTDDPLEFLMDKRGRRDWKPDVNVIAKHIYPAAFAPYEKWSREIADRRQEARCAAQTLIRDRPERARKIMKAYLRRRCELVRERRSLGATRKELASEFELSMSAIDHILYG